MRSWTIFVLFGCVLVALLIFTQVSKYSTATHPAVQATQKFFDAVKKNNAQDANKFLDIANGKLNAAGNNIVSVSFKETQLFKGAFVQQPAVTWKYLDLAGMTVDIDAKPHEDEASGIATVRLLDGYQVQLKKVDTEWKVFYIIRPKKH